MHVKDVFEVSSPKVPFARLAKKVEGPNRERIEVVSGPWIGLEDVSLGTVVGSLSNQLGLASVQRAHFQKVDQDQVKDVPKHWPVIAGALARGLWVDELCRVRARADIERI